MTAMHKEDTGRRITNILLYGAVWGIVEATLGYALHLLGRVVPVVGLAGFVLFPVGLLIMLAATRATGLALAPLGVSVVAAATKAASVAAPGVTPIFVINPSLAILAEGAIVSAGVVLFAFSRPVPTFAGTLAMSIGWRVLFLTLLAVLPVRAGILMKGTTALLYFLIVESAVNAILVAGVFAIGFKAERLGELISRAATPVAVPAALALAVAFQMLAAVT